MPERRPTTKRDPGGRPGSRFFVSGWWGLLSLALLAPAACVVEDRPADEDPAGAEAAADIEDIRTMLNASADSWNSGDLGGFVDDYTDDPALAFVGSTGVTRGIAEVRARYESGYWAGGGPADSLRFEGLELTPLGDRHALALGRYVLYQPGSADAGESVTSTGWFSLVLGHDGERWRILHDHSSALEEG
jgi:ketosteroid isomerase-like protein